MTTVGVVTTSGWVHKLCALHRDRIAVKNSAKSVIKAIDDNMINHHDGVLRGWGRYRNMLSLACKAQAIQSFFLG